jgi:hypothetical protein
MSARGPVVSAGPKKIHLYTELFADELMVATGESLYVHVDSTAGWCTCALFRYGTKADTLRLARSHRHQEARPCLIFRPSPM